MHNVAAKDEELTPGLHDSQVKKVDKYAWKISGKPGVFMDIDKHELRVNHEYQRTKVSQKNILSYARKWSWFSCGTLKVGFRDNAFWVVDGQHRLSAALKRSDISMLPCMVFEVENIGEEAHEFAAGNGGEPVSPIDKWRAACVEGNKTALWVRDILEHFGITIKQTPSKARECKCIQWMLKVAPRGYVEFEKILRVALEVSGDHFLSERVLETIRFLHNNIDGGILSDERFLVRLVQLGAPSIIKATHDAGKYYGQGGGKTWSLGVLDLVNKGLRNKYYLSTTKQGA